MIFNSYKKANICYILLNRRAQYVMHERFTLHLFFTSFLWKEKHHDRTFLYQSRQDLTIRENFIMIFCSENNDARCIFLSSLSRFLLRVFVKGNSREKSVESSFECNARKREHPVAKICDNFCGIQKRRYIYGLDVRIFFSKSSFERQSGVNIHARASLASSHMMRGLFCGTAKFSFIEKLQHTTITRSRMAQWKVR